MKIFIAKATVKAVTPLMLNMGEEQVPATSLTIAGQLPPDVLDEFDEKLKGLLFKKDIPQFPQIGAMKWIPEYENAALTIHGYKFAAVEVAKIEFAAEAGYFVEFKMTVKITNPSEEMAGKLNALLRHEVKVRVEKATQKVIDPEAGDDDDQPKTKDGKPIQPLLPGTVSDRPEPPTTKH